MKEFFFFSIAFILFLLLRLAKNQLNAKLKIFISILFVGVLLVGMISRMVTHFSWQNLFILGAILILFTWKLISYIRQKRVK
jgi:hypothetical protein